MVRQQIGIHATYQTSIRILSIGKRKIMSTTQVQKDPKPVGRPLRVFSETEIKEIQGLASRLTKTQIADYMKVSFSTFREIEKRQPEVSEAYQKGKADQIDEVAGLLLTQCRTGSIPAILFYLKTQAGWKEEEEERRDLPQLNIIVTTDAPNATAV
jgi:hypothetical protein